MVEERDNAEIMGKLWRFNNNDSSEEQKQMADIKNRKLTRMFRVKGFKEHVELKEYESSYEIKYWSSGCAGTFKNIRENDTIVGYEMDLSPEGLLGLPEHYLVTAPRRDPKPEYIRTHYLRWFDEEPLLFLCAHSISVNCPSCRWMQ